VARVVRPARPSYRAADASIGQRHTSPPHAHALRAKENSVEESIPGGRIRASGSGWRDRL
jgi:hypothetical protein